jgi:hypothetical protein
VTQLVLPLQEATTKPTTEPLHAVVEPVADPLHTAIDPAGAGAALIETSCLSIQV